MAYAMFLNLFLFGAEIFKEYYSEHRAPGAHPVPLRGLHGHNGARAPTPGSSIFCSVVAFFLFLIPKTAEQLRDPEHRLRC